MKRSLFLGALIMGKTNLGTIVDAPTQFLDHLKESSRGYLSPQNLKLN